VSCYLLSWSGEGRDSRSRTNGSAGLPAGQRDVKCVHEHGRLVVGTVAYDHMDPINPTNGRIRPRPHVISMYRYLLEILCTIPFIQFVDCKISQGRGTRNFRKLPYRFPSNGGSVTSVPEHTEHKLEMCFPTKRANEPHGTTW
jgi:hypothetical protein